MTAVSLLRDNSNTLDFLSISGELQVRILKKADYFTLANFEGTCKEIKEKCENLQPIIVAHELHVQPESDVLQQLQMTKGRGWALKFDRSNYFYNSIPENTVSCTIYAAEIHISPLLKFANVNDEILLSKIKAFKLTGKKLHADYFADFYEGLPKIIEATKVEELVMASSFTPRSLCESAVFRNLSSVYLSSHDFCDEDLLLLKAKDIRIDCCGLNPAVTNIFLKQWKESQREICRFRLITAPNSAADRVDEIIDNLFPSLVWSHQYHSQSFIGHVHAAEIPDNEFQYHRFVYSICKPEDIHNPLILFLNETSLEIISNLNEVRALGLILERFYKYMV